MKSVFLLMLFSSLNYAASQSDNVNKTINETKPDLNTDSGGVDLPKLIDQIFPKPDNDSTSNTEDDTSDHTLPPIGGDIFPDSGTCECVPYYLCSNSSSVKKEDGINDIRPNDEPADSCDYLSVCCKEPDRISPPNLNLTKVEGCGSRNPEGVGFQITGAEDNEAHFAEFPWMVAVLHEQAVKGNSQKSLVYQCGAALIHPSVVLTAAHCVAGKDKQYQIRAGEWDSQTKNELFAHQDRKVKTVINHPDYYAGALFNDVAILILESPLEIAENVDVICLPKQNMVIDEARCFASGWGKDVFGKEGTYQVILKKIELSIVPRNTCQDSLRTTRLGERFKLHSSFICAGGEPGKDTCTGDGGSPLVCPISGQPGRYLQAGIVAWGIGCGEKQIPGVYANVAQFTDWIDEQLAANNFNVSYYKY